MGCCQIEERIFNTRALQIENVKSSKRFYLHNIPNLECYISKFPKNSQTLVKIQLYQTFLSINSFNIIITRFKFSVSEKGGEKRERERGRGF